MVFLKMENYLPEIPKQSNERPPISAYRALGIIVMLDIDYPLGISEATIDWYYWELVHHLKNQTAFISIGDDDKPNGYALWEISEADSKSICLKRRVAPFGDHAELYRKLRSVHFPDSKRVLSHHLWSAREIQVAW